MPEQQLIPFPTSDEIRPFNISKIMKEVEEAISSLPEGAKGAVLGYADGEQAGLAVMARLSKGWSFVGRIDKPYSGKLEAHASIRLVW